MTKLLDAALARVAQLPADDQDRIASLILEELESEAAWQERFRSSQAKLAGLAAAARQEITRGEVRDEDPATVRRG
ncbi:MAG: hypothetical protein ACREJ0_07650 [Geminicoccaceae bacterium]